MKIIFLVIIILTSQYALAGPFDRIYLPFAQIKNISFKMKISNIPLRLSQNKNVNIIYQIDYKAPDEIKLQIIEGKNQLEKSTEVLITEYLSDYCLKFLNWSSSLDLSTYKLMFGTMGEYIFKNDGTNEVFNEVIIIDKPKEIVEIIKKGSGTIRQSIILEKLGWTDKQVITTINGLDYIGVEKNEYSTQIKYKKFDNKYYPSELIISSKQIIRDTAADRLEISRKIEDVIHFFDYIEG